MTEVPDDKRWKSRVERIAHAKWVRNEQRKKRPHGDALLSMYARMTAKEIAKEYCVKEWMVRSWIREARSMPDDSDIPRL